MALCRNCIFNRLSTIKTCVSSLSTNRSSYYHRTYTTENSTTTLDVLKSKAEEFSGKKVELFENIEVQRLLKRLTGLDLNKVFSTRKEELGNPVYKVLDEAELKKDEDDAIMRAQQLLKMPPVMKKRSRIERILSKEESIIDYDPDSSNYVFTDISPSENHRTNAVLVRENASGILREGNWDERDRMQYIYWPKEGQHHEIIPMLQDEYLPRLFDELRHEDILDLINVQSEPDSPDYIRVHERVYNNIDSMHLYDVLQSTRHYGGLLFYLIQNNMTNNLLTYYIKNGSSEDAIDLVKLYCLIHPESEATKRIQDVHEDNLILKEYLLTEGLHHLIEMMENNTKEQHELSS